MRRPTEMPAFLRPIDPVYYDAAYFLAPDGEAGGDVYAVLREAIAKTGMTALAGCDTSEEASTSAISVLAPAFVMALEHQRCDQIG